ncbi:MAG TPA: manganese efflux pump MntP family protein [Myxococcaceae bacterium]|nr:manganese efflux pump MntP family protein [Myxococcaceae bacterium]
MNFGAILALSVGLAMDAAAVSAARGMAVPAVRLRHAVRVALFFGGFQALMPVVGWLVGARVGPLVEAWDHWIAFVLLGAIGAKMLWEARGSKEDARPRSEAEVFGFRVMLVLAVATSIDALAVGITLPMLDAPFALSVITIGVTTAVLCVAALVAGRRAGAMLGRRLDMLGGVILIGLGVKILVEHLRAG